MVVRERLANSSNNVWQYLKMGAECPFSNISKRVLKYFRTFPGRPTNIILKLLLSFFLRFGQTRAQLDKEVSRLVDYSGFVIYDFSTDRRSSILAVWAAPGGRETFQMRGGQSPPPFWKVSRPPRAAQIPKIDDFRSVEKSYFTNPL